jgi:hypothetical protein
VDRHKRPRSRPRLPRTPQILQVRSRKTSQTN